MSTRGLIGFRLDEKNYLTYNHHDSYPAGIGKDIVDFLNTHKNDMDGMKQSIRALKFVKSGDKVPDSELEKYAQYTTKGVGEDNTWYQVLHNTQGDLEAILESGIMTDDHTFVKDSLFCEWGYVVNLDAMTLEVYRGFQTSKGNGRFNKWARKTPPKSWKPPYNGAEYYWPISLIAVFPFDELPDMVAFEATVRDKEEATV